MCASCNAKCDIGLSALGNDAKITKGGVPREKHVDMLEVARTSMNFGNFQDRMHDRDIVRQHTKEVQPKNLIELAVETQSENENFEAFREKAKTLRRRA
jgi:hypothetical protein